MLTVVRKPEVVFEEEAGVNVSTPVVLLPSRIEKMLAARSAYQEVKFRSTCSDCVPNL